jgi:hypothetical protein
VNLPRIDRPLTTQELRDRILAQLNGEHRRLSAADQKRRRQALERLRRDVRGDGA